MTFEEIAIEIGVTRERARQIYNNAIRKMVRAIGREDLCQLLACIDSRREYAVPSEGGRANWAVE